MRLQEILSETSGVENVKPIPKGFYQSMLFRGTAYELFLGKQFEPRGNGGFFPNVKLADDVGNTLFEEKLAEQITGILNDLGSSFEGTYNIEKAIKNLPNVINTLKTTKPDKQVLANVQGPSVDNGQMVTLLKITDSDALLEVTGNGIPPVNLIIEQQTYTIGGGWIDTKSQPREWTIKPEYDIVDILMERGADKQGKQKDFITILRSAIVALDNQYGRL